MENKPTYRKTGIAIGSVFVLREMKPENYIELAVVGCMTVIVLVAILSQWNLDKEKKNETKNNSSGRIDPANL